MFLFQEMKSLAYALLVNWERVIKLIFQLLAHYSLHHLNSFTLMYGAPHIQFPEMVHATALASLMHILVIHGPIFSSYNLKYTVFFKPFTLMFKYNSIIRLKPYKHMGVGNFDPCIISFTLMAYTIDFRVLIPLNKTVSLSGNTATY